MQELRPPPQRDAAQPSDKGQGWWRDLTRYHWWIFIIATLGWMFDMMDQRLFTLARGPALKELLGAFATPEAARAAQDFYGGLATAMMLLGWATGGIIFGLMGDRWGRVKTMLLTILCYSLFTGLCALSQSWWDFCLYRFLTGMGVGGEFAAGVSLVAEAMPARARPHTLGLLQAMGSVGNMIGAAIGYFVLPSVLQFSGLALHGWRLLFLIGVLPSLLVVFALRKLEEPRAWIEAKAAQASGDPSAHKLGSWKELLGDRTWRYHTIIGVILAMVGVVGLWGVTYWVPDLIRDHILKDSTPTHQKQMASLSTALIDVGAVAGIMLFTWLTVRIGRRGAFALAFVTALGSSLLVFGFMTHESQMYWMAPLLGFGSLAIFGGYTIYFPELFPTRLRSTGTGFCYNVARYLAASGPFLLGGLGMFYTKAGFQGSWPLRWAAISVAAIYVVGLIALPWAPETKDKPLPS